MIIHTYEEGGRADAAREYIEEHRDKIPYKRLIILPIPTTKDKVHLRGSEVLISDIVNNSLPGDAVIGYDLPTAFSEALLAKGVGVYDAGRDEEFLLENAELTALAALGILLTGGRRALSDIRFGIVGYGRIGKKLARMLLFHGAFVRIYTSKSKTMLELGALGLSVLESSESADLSDIDVLINTAPAPIFGSNIPEKVRVIDLASGENFPRGRAESYPSVPAKMFPISAGRALGRGALKYFTSEK